MLHGGCPIHSRATRTDVARAKELHPASEVLVHPECTPDVVSLADFVSSTSAIIQYAAQWEQKEFIIGTDISIAQHLSYQFPEKRFYLLSKELICPNMKATSLIDLYHAVSGNSNEEIDLDEETIRQARICIDRMIEFG